MMRNEKIAEKMGWVIFKDKSLGAVAKDQDGDGFPFMPESITSDSPTGHWLAHLLIERMVEDGWEITTNIGKERGWAEALRFDGELYHRIGVDHEYKVAGNNSVMDFPTAVVELFCKVYGILDGE